MVHFRKKDQKRGGPREVWQKIILFRNFFRNPSLFLRSLPNVFTHPPQGFVRFGRTKGEIQVEKGDCCCIFIFDFEKVEMGQCRDGQIAPFLWFEPVASDFHFPMWSLAGWVRISGTQTVRGSRSISRPCLRTDFQVGLFVCLNWLYCLSV